MHFGAFGVRETLTVTFPRGFVTFNVHPMTLECPFHNCYSMELHEIVTRCCQIIPLQDTEISQFSIERIGYYLCLNFWSLTFF